MLSHSTDGVSEMACTAVVVHYGDVRPTLVQVEAVRSWADAVIVVANDGTLDDWFGQDPAVNWLTPDGNLGYGGAANYAAMFSESRVLALLNTDVSLPSGTARRAVQFLRADGSRGIVAPRLQRDGGLLLSGAGQVSPVVRRCRTREVRAESERCDWVSGAVMFITRECLRAIRFDERYFLGMEDVDFCFRAKAAGWSTHVLDDHETVHRGGEVIGPARWYYYAFRNPLWFAKVYTPPLSRTLLFGTSALLVARVAIADIIKRRGLARTSFAFRGLLDGLSLSPEPGTGPYQWEPVSADRMPWRARSYRLRSSEESRLTSTPHCLEAES